MKNTRLNRKLMSERAEELGLVVNKSWHIKVLTQLVNKELNRLRSLVTVKKTKKIVCVERGFDQKNLF